MPARIKITHGTAVLTVITTMTRRSPPKNSFLTSRRSPFSVPAISLPMRHMGWGSQRGSPSRQSSRKAAASIQAIFILSPHTRGLVHISLDKMQIDDENFIAFRIVSLYATHTTKGDIPFQYFLANKKAAFSFQRKRLEANYLRAPPIKQVYSPLPRNTYFL